MQLLFDSYMATHKSIPYLPSLTAGGASSINTAILNSSWPNPITASAAFQLYKETLADQECMILCLT